MAKKKNIITEDVVKDEKSTPVERRDDLYKKKINPVSAPKQKLGMDMDSEFYDALIAAMQKNELDIGKLESFTQITNNRNQVYNLIDTMAEDSTIAAVLETYAEDATETSMEGKIVWAEARDEKVAKYVTYLLDTMNIDKNAYKWVYSLCKYGDLYLRLYRESEYNDALFDSDDEEDKAKHAESKKLNETLNNALNSNLNDPTSINQEISREEASMLDDLDEEFADNSNSTNILKEDVKLKAFSQNDRYAHYVEMIPNPAEVYELTRLGKSYAYIQAPTNISLRKPQEALQGSTAFTGRYSYAFKKNDVLIFEPTEFVHAALEDNSSRTPEEVNIFLTDSDYETNSNSLSYKVRRGQSLLYNSYKIWRELSLLEYSLLLNRVTKSSIIRAIGVEVGDMPKEQIGPHLAGIKSLVEQKSALNIGGGLSEYTNPGPIENNIYIPVHDGIGALNVQQIGGDVNVTGLDDLDYFKNKYYGGLRIPKQYFGDTDDSTGFNGGTSLSIISSRYAKTVKRVQKTFIQAITDIINLMLIDKGLTSYVNKFTLRMVSPTTQEEIDRQDSISTKVQLANDIMLMLSEVKDLSARLKVLKSLLDNAISDPTVAEVLQEQIDNLEALKASGVELDENGDPIQPDIEGGDGLTGTQGGGDFDFDETSDDSDNLDIPTDDTSSDNTLPTPDSLGVDFTNNDL